MTVATDQGANPPILLHHRLRIAREYAGFDQEQLAAAIGVARSTIVNAEKGHVHPRRITVKSWARVCGVSEAWLTASPLLLPRLDSNQQPFDCEVVPLSTGGFKHLAAAA